MNDPDPDRTPPRSRSALSAFLEAHNILWGELVGGLLVVGCSLALVLTFWSTIRDNPNLQVVTFTGAVAGVYAAGLYTLRRWRLETTGRGLLAVALLLTPVCQLALTLGGGAGVRLALPAGSLLVLGVLAWRAARVLCPRTPIGLTLAVVLTTACLAPVERLVGPGTAGWTVLLLGLLAVTATGLPTVASLIVLDRGPLDRAGALSVFALLGLAGFPLVVVLSLLAGLTEDVPGALGRLALPLALAMLLPLFAGAVVHGGLEDDPDAGGPRTAGTALVLAGLAGMLLAVGLAWPRPESVLAVCALDFAVCTGIAFRTRLPLAHGLALPCLAVALVAGLALAGGAGAVDDAGLSAFLRGVALAPTTGLALLVLAGLCALVGEGLVRVAPAHGRVYAGGALVLALVALGLVSAGGQAEAGWAALTFPAVGVTALLLNRRWHQPRVDLLGWGLVAAAGPWALWRVDPGFTEAWPTWLVLEAFALAAWPLLRPRTRTWPAALTVATAVALAALVLAVGMAPWKGAGAPGLILVTWAGLALYFNLTALVRGDRWLAGVAALLVPAAWAVIGRRLDWPGGLSVPLASSVALLAGGVLGLRRWHRDTALTLAWTTVAALATVPVLAGLLDEWALPILAVSLALLATAALLLAVAYRAGPLTLVGSLLALAALAHLLTFGVGLVHPVLLAALLHATVTLPAARGLRRAGLEPFGRPVQTGALLATLLAAPLLLTGAARDLDGLARCAVWLAVLWLVFAFLEAAPVLFAAAQGALFLAGGLVVAAHLRALGQALTDPVALQTFGLVLALLALAMTVVWQASPRWRVGLERLRPRPWPTLDEVVLGLLVVAQLAVAVWGIAPGLAEELGPAPPADWFGRIPVVAEVHAAAGPLAATGWTAAALVAVLAVALAVLARPTLRPPVLLGLLTLALTLAVLAAGQCADGRATATGLRWGLAIGFVVCSLPVWLRDRLGPWAARWGFGAGPDDSLASWARQALVLGAVVPVLAITVTAALLGVSGSPVLGPAPHSVFARMGGLAAAGWPLGLVCLGLIVHALRERLPGYAFAVGLGGNVLASLLLRAAFRKTPLAEWWLPLLQANALAFGAGALLWLTARRRLYPERGTGILLVTQVGLGVLANGVLLALVVGFLLVSPGEPPVAVAQAGSVLGWLALGLTAAAVLWNARVSGARSHLTPAVLLALAAGVLLAATSAGLSGGPPWLAYHTLTASWAVVAGVLLVHGWRRAAGPDLFPAWAQDVGLLVLGLALVGAARDPWRAWSPAVVLFVSGLGAALAIWQRRESRALFAGLGVNLAATLALPCFLSDGVPILEQAPLLVRVNLLVASGWALVWLAGCRWIYGTVRPTEGVAPLLHVQVFGLLGLGAVLLLVPLAALVATPGASWADLPPATGWEATLAVVLAVLALVFARRTGSVSLLQLVGGFGLASGVLLAWSAIGRTPDPSVPFRILEVSWAVLGAGLLAFALAVHGRRPVGLAEPGYVAWVLACGVLLFGLVWRSWWFVPDSLTSASGLFAELGLVALLVAELVVLAWWRRSGSYLLLAEFCALATVYRLFGWGDKPPFWQAAAVVAGLTALLWLAFARRLYAVQRPGLFQAPLLRCQLALAAILGVVKLVDPAGQFFQEGSSALAPAAGGVGGWLALLVGWSPLAWFLGGRARRAWVPLFAVFGLFLSVLAACSVARVAPGWPPFHVLAALGTAWGLVLLLAGFPRDHRGFHGVTTLCVAGLGGLILWLAGLAADREAFGRAALAAGPVTLLALGLVVRRHREVWFFAAALILQFTVLLLVQHGQQEGWWPAGFVFQVQASAAVAALFALVWVSLGRPLYGIVRPGPWAAPLLAVQVLLPVLANLYLLTGPLVALLLDPGKPGVEVAQAGHAAGWAALALTLVAVVVYAGRTLAWVGLHGTCLLGLAVGVLAACSAARWDETGAWLAYHTLTAGWVVLGTVLVTVGGLGGRGWLHATWAALLTVLVLVLGVRGLVGGDPSVPWGPPATVLAGGALAGGMALWRRREAWALTAAVCGNVAVCIVLLPMHRDESLADWWPTLVRVNVFVVTASASLWLCAARRLYGVARPARAAAPLLTAVVALVAAGAMFLVVDPVVRLVWQPVPVPVEVRDAGRPLSWLAVLAAGVVAARHLRIHMRRAGPDVFAGFALGAVALAAAAASAFDTDNLLAYHVLAGGIAGVGALVLLRGQALARSPMLLDSKAGGMPAVLGWRLDLALAVVLALGCGLAVRETAGLGGVAFPAGLVAVLGGLAAVRARWRHNELWAAAATLAWAFAVSLVVWDVNGRGLDRDSWTPLLQANSITLSLGALLWMAAQGRRRGGTRFALVGAQVLLALAANAWLLLDPALVELIRSPAALPASVAGAGGWDFWLTFGSTALAAGVTLGVRRPRFAVHVLGGLGVAFGILLACSAARADRGDFLAYHVLLVAWAFQAVLLVGAAWSGRAGVSASAAQAWLALLGVPLLGLAVRGTLPDPGGAWWSAGTVLVVAALAGVLAAWLRHPAWALLAGLGIDLALSLVVWREHAGQPLTERLLPLGQVVVAALSLAALLWLILGRRPAGTAPPLADSALLVVQVVLALAGNAALLVVPAYLLFLSPQSPDPLAGQIGGRFGWLGLVPALTAALWLAGRRLGPGAVARLWPIAGLALGVLAGAWAVRWDDGHWQAFQTLAGCWAVLALAAGWSIRQARLAAGVLGGLLLLLAVRTLAGNFLVPWWAAGAVLTVAASWAGVAVMSRSEPWALASGLCANLAATLVLLPNPLGVPEEALPLVLVSGNTAVAGLVALAWLHGRARSGVTAPPGPLLGLQLLVTGWGTFGVVVSGFLFLVISPRVLLPLVPLVGPWGALNLVPAALIAWSLRRYQSAEVRGHLRAVCTLGGLVVACCWLTLLDRGDFLAYHALTTALALFGCALLLRPRLVEPAPAREVADGWVCLTAALLVLMGLRAVGLDPAGRWGPAATVLVPALLLAGLALRRQQEGLAFLAGLLGNVAVTLLLLPEVEQPEGPYRLIQGNVLASATAALLWLAGARRLRSLTVAALAQEPRPSESGFVHRVSGLLLRVQCSLGLVGLFPLLFFPGVELLRQPYFPAQDGAVFLAWFGTVDQWATVLLAGLPVIWHARLTRSSSLAHPVGDLGLAVGVLTACTVSRFDPTLAHRVLTFAWLLAGWVVLAGGWRGLWDRGAAFRSAVFVLLTLFLSVTGVDTDPGGGSWAAVAVAGAAGLAAGVAVWRRSDPWAFAAGLIANLTACLVFRHLNRAAFAFPGILLIQVNLATTAAATVLWALVARRQGGIGLQTARHPAAPLRTLQTALVFTAQFGLLLLASLAIFGDVVYPDNALVGLGGPWGWLTLLLTAAALLTHFGLPRRTEWPALVGAGLLLLGVQLAASAYAVQAGPWVAFRVLSLAWASAGLLLAGLSWVARLRAVSEDGMLLAQPAPRLGSWNAWALPFAGLSLVLALRVFLVDPLGPWWAVGGVTTAAAVGVLLALRCREDGWAGAAGLCVNLAVTLALVRSHFTDPLEAWWLTLAWANVLAAAGVALLWVLARRPRVGVPGGPLLTTQIGVTLGGNGLLLAVPLVALLVRPGDLLPVVLASGGVLPWLALVATAVVVVWGGRRALGENPATVLLVACGVGAGVLAACSAAPADHGQWLSYHVLQGAWGLLVAVVLGVGVWLAPSGRVPVASPVVALHGWTVLLGLLLAGLAVPRDLDPTGPWASSATLLGVAVLAGGLAVWVCFQPYVVTSGVFLVLAVVGFGLGLHHTGPMAIVLLIVLGLAASTFVWAPLESWLRRRTPPRDLRRGVPVPFAHVAVLAALLVLVLLAGWVNGGGAVHVLTGPALAAVGLALLACLWDADASFPLVGVYVLCLTAFALFLPRLAPEHLGMLAAGVAGFVSGASGFRRASFWPGVERALDVPARRGGWPTAWFGPTQTAVGVLVALVSLWFCFNHDPQWHFLTGPVVAALLLPAPWLLLRPGRVVPRALTLALVALVLAEVLAVSLPTGAPWSDLTALLAALFGLLALVYAVILPLLTPRDATWRGTERGGGVVAAFLALPLLAGTLAGEAGLPPEWRTPVVGMAPALILAAVLLTLAAAGVVLALRPGLDPLGLSERRRSGYVYAGELLVVVLAVHLRLALPWLFTHHLEPYWPFAVFALAFLGAAASELLGRLGLRVLARPLLRTGAFLPLLPVVGFWLRPAGDYAMLWFLAGLFYALLAVTRRSLAFALLALLAANGGLWVVLHDNQLAFVRYPQLWVVPVALSVLAAGQLNRDRLGQRQLLTLRYAALAVIYLASTADAFVGLGHEVWRPLVLIGLALAGVFLGMLLRVRAFLFLGTGFVALGVFTLVWHAATAQAWVWYAAGIPLGALIFILFAIFEKRRAEVLAMLERLREWE